MCVVCVMHTWSSEDSYVELVLSFHLDMDSGGGGGSHLELTGWGHILSLQTDEMAHGACHQALSLIPFHNVEGENWFLESFLCLLCIRYGPYTSFLAAMRYKEIHNFFKKKKSAFISYPSCHLYSLGFYFLILKGKKMRIYLWRNKLLIKTLRLSL